MEIIKEMHDALHNERHSIEKEEAQLNTRLQDLNRRRAALVRKESELNRLTNVFYNAGASVGNYPGCNQDAAGQGPDAQINRSSTPKTFL